MQHSLSRYDGLPHLTFNGFSREFNKHICFNLLVESVPNSPATEKTSANQKDMMSCTDMTQHYNQSLAHTHFSN